MNIPHLYMIDIIFSWLLEEIFLTAIKMLFKRLSIIDKIKRLIERR